MIKNYPLYRADIQESAVFVFQGTKKFRSDSPGLEDFVVRLVEFILHLPDGQVKVFRGHFSEKLTGAL